MPNKDLTLFAGWRRVNYYVDFKLNGGTDPGNDSYVMQTVPSGDTLSVVPNPERPGYSFAGWYTDEGLTPTSSPGAKSCAPAVPGSRLSLQPTICQPGTASPGFSCASPVPVGSVTLPFTCGTCSLASSSPASGAA